MPNKFAFLILSFAVTACAANQAEQSGPSIKERIKEARKSVNVLMPDSPDWCSPAASCSYVADIHCDKESGTKEKGYHKCINKLRSKTVKLGGDTLVVQSIKLTEGQNEVHDAKLHTRAFAQVYRCSDANVALSHEFLANNRGPMKFSFQTVTETYHSKCNASKKCEPVRAINCSSVQGNPFKLCMVKIDTKEITRTPFTHLVLKQDLFNKIHFYRMFAEALTCK